MFEVFGLRLSAAALRVKSPPPDMAFMAVDFGAELSPGALGGSQISEGHFGVERPAPGRCVHIRCFPQANPKEYLIAL